jgi:hypothetical protein
MKQRQGIHSAENRRIPWRALADDRRKVVAKQLRETELPVAIAEVRLAPNPQHSTARGALVAAMSET